MQGTTMHSINGPGQAEECAAVVYGNGASRQLTQQVVGMPTVSLVHQASADSAASATAADSAPLLSSRVPELRQPKKKFTVTQVPISSASGNILFPVHPSSQNLAVPGRKTYKPVLEPLGSDGGTLRGSASVAAAAAAAATAAASGSAGSGGGGGSSNSTSVPVPPVDPYLQNLTVNSFADFIVKSRSTGMPSTVGKVLQRLPGLNHSRARRRLVFKNGDCNVSNKRIQKVHRQFLADIYTSIVDLKWRYILLMCATTFMSSWLFFGALWFVIGYAHGDFDEDESKRPQKPCILEVHGFVTAFLYSIETQHTIGYGGRQLTDACPEAVVLLMIQSLFGMILQALTTGAMFAKLARPKKRAETLMFSRSAVICKRDGHMCLMFRIGDMRRSHLVGANVRALMIRRRVSKEGEVLPLDNANVALGLSPGEDRLMIVWPIIVLHCIDENSPFWHMSRADLERENFELIVILEGVIEATGMTTQARTSYLPGEILWGHRLERLITFQKEDGKYKVDYSRFHATTPVDTPACSAKELHEASLQEQAHSSYDDDGCGGGGDSATGIVHRQSSASSTGSCGDSELVVPEVDDEYEHDDYEVEDESQYDSSLDEDVDDEEIEGKHS